MLLGTQGNSRLTGEGGRHPRSELDTPGSQGCHLGASQAKPETGILRGGQGGTREAGHSGLGGGSFHGHENSHSQGPGSVLTSRSLHPLAERWKLVQRPSRGSVPCRRLDGLSTTSRSRLCPRGSFWEQSRGGEQKAQPDGGGVTSLQLPGTSPW